MATSLAVMANLVSAQHVAFCKTLPYATVPNATAVFLSLEQKVMAFFAPCKEKAVQPELQIVNDRL